MVRYGIIKCTYIIYESYSDIREVCPSLRERDKKNNKRRTHIFVFTIEGANTSQCIYFKIYDTHINIYDP